MHYRCHYKVRALKRGALSLPKHCPSHTPLLTSKDELRSCDHHHPHHGRTTPQYRKQPKALPQEQPGEQRRHGRVAEEDGDAVCQRQAQDAFVETRHGSSTYDAAPRQYREVASLAEEWRDALIACHPHADPRSYQ